MKARGREGGLKRRGSTGGGRQRGRLSCDGGGKRGGVGGDRRHAFCSAKDEEGGGKGRGPKKSDSNVGEKGVGDENGRKEGGGKPQSRTLEVIFSAAIWSLPSSFFI